MNAIENANSYTLDTEKVNQTLRQRGYPALGDELDAEAVSQLKIGTPFYVRRNSDPILSMAMGVTANNQVKVAQLSAGRVSFALSSIGAKTFCYEAVMH